MQFITKTTGQCMNTTCTFKDKVMKYQYKTIEPDEHLLYSTVYSGDILLQDELIEMDEANGTTVRKTLYNGDMKLITTMSDCEHINDTYHSDFVENALFVDNIKKYEDYIDTLTTNRNAIHFIDDNRKMEIEYYGISDDVKCIKYYIRGIHTSTEQYEYLAGGYTIHRNWYDKEGFNMNSVTEYIENGKVFERIDYDDFNRETNYEIYNN